MPEILVENIITLHETNVNIPHIYKLSGQIIRISG